MCMVNNFYCTCCGNKGIPIPRPGKRRKSGHLKKLFCLTCQRETNHVEITRGEYNLTWFNRELHCGNFDKSGNRKKPFGEFKNWWYNNKDKKE